MSVTGYPKKSLCLGLTRSPSTDLVACALRGCSFIEEADEMDARAKAIRTKHAQDNPIE